jgi:hypothetical protein
MADESTPNLGLTKPDVGASDDTWGGKLNDNFDKIDNAVGGITSSYVTDSELNVILDGYTTDSELSSTLSSYVLSSNFNEMTDDRVAALLVPGANITITYNDASNTLTVASTASGGTGDVVGPAGAVTDRIATFNGATGKIIKDGGKLISDLALTTAVPVPATAVPLVEAVAGVVGTSVKYAREDHVHPLVPGSGGGASVTISDTPPASPSVGNLWWESDTGNIYIYYNDGNSSQWVVVIAGNAAAQVIRSYLAGLTLSTAGSSATFGIAAGVAANSTNTAMMSLLSAYTKTTAAWAVGSGNGALDIGAIAASTWYHVFLIRRLDTSVVDVLISLSATAPTLPANYTQFRRIGSLLTNASSQWTAFVQNGDTFIWDTQIGVLVAIVNPGTAAVTRLAATPLGIITRAIIGVLGATTNSSTDSPASILLTDLAQSDTVPSSTNFSFYCYSSQTTGFQLGGTVEVNTNTSSQYRSRLQLSAPGTNIYLTTIGWIDRRGKDA